MRERTTIFRSIFFILLTAGIVITSCKKDSDPSDDLIGTWNSTSSSFDAMVGNKTLVQYFTEDMGLSAADAQLAVSLFNVTLQQNFTGTIKFNSDNTYTSTLGGQNETGTWSLSSDGDKLTIDPSTDDAIIFDVDTLTASQLQVHFSETGSDDLNGDNVPETISITANMTFSKQ